MRLELARRSLAAASYKHRFMQGLKKAMPSSDGQLEILMRLTLMAMAVAASAGYLGSGWAVAQTTPNLSPTGTPSTQSTSRDTPGGQAGRDARTSDARARDTATRTAKPDTRKKTDAKSCLALKGAEERACLKRAKGSYAEAIAEANRRGPGVGTTAVSPGGPVPALQTQSSAVNATGIAPSTVGPDRTPGTQAVPSK